MKNEFGYACEICDRLWFKRDLKFPAQFHKQALGSILPNFTNEETLLCPTCMRPLTKNKVPIFVAINGFKYPSLPDYLSPLHIISERLISPRCPLCRSVD